MERKFLCGYVCSGLWVLFLCMGGGLAVFVRDVCVFVYACCGVGG